MKYKVVILVTLVSLFLSSNFILAAEVSGKIVAINENEETILLKEQQGVKEYKLGFNAQIRLNEKIVKLAALRPIDYKSFCEAQLQLNQVGEITAVNAAYRALEIVVLQVEKEHIIVKKLDTGLTRNFKVTEKVKMKRNNLKVNSEDIRRGDKGLVILGLDNQLQKIILYNYEVYGILKDSNPHTREVVLNTGTRLEPKYKTLKLPLQTKIRFKEHFIKFKELTANMWVKVEIDKSIQQVVVRKI